MGELYGKEMRERAERAEARVTEIAQALVELTDARNRLTGEVGALQAKLRVVYLKGMADGVEAFMAAVADEPAKTKTQYVWAGQELVRELRVKLKEDHG